MGLELLTAVPAPRWEEIPFESWQHRADCWNKQQLGQGCQGQAGRGQAAGGQPPGPEPTLGSPPQ